MSGTDDKNIQPGAEDKDKNLNTNPNDPPAGDPPGEDDLASFSDPEKAKAEIKKLRAEAAKHRTKAKQFETDLSGVNKKLDALKKALGGEEEQDEPEVQVGKLRGQNEALALDNSILQLAIENDIPKGQTKYFRFLLAEKLEGLKDNEELSEDDISAVVAEVKKVGGKPAANSTGLNGGSTPPPDDKAGAITVEQFAKMNTGEKSELYAKNKAEYDRLFQAAREKRLI